MLDRILEYRESQQYRKQAHQDKMRKQSFRYLLILMALTLVVGLGAAAVNAAKPAQTVKGVAAQATVTAAKTQEISEIEEFADIVTKPLDQLTDADMALLNVKAKDPCYEKYALLDKGAMIDAITKCKEAS